MRGVLFLCQAGQGVVAGQVVLQKMVFPLPNNEGQNFQILAIDFEAPKKALQKTCFFQIVFELITFWAKMRP
jgi:hypothetical protein